jgi:uncharacterized delta-60 repeat protein
MKHQNKSSRAFRVKRGAGGHIWYWFLILTVGLLPAHGATITIVNLDGAGEGLNDNTAATPVGGNPGVTLGQQRLNVFQRAADILGPQLQSTIVIRVAASFDPLDCDPDEGILGAAGPNTVHRNFTGAPLANTWYVAASANSRANADLATAANDIGAQFNSNVGQPGCLEIHAWYYGFDGNAPANSFDFLSTVLHEIYHGLGFLSLVDLATGQRFMASNDAYMRLLENHANGLLYPGMTDAQRVAASIANGNLHWVGANVVARSGILTAGRTGTHVHMYAPNPAQPGSSVSHFRDNLAPDELMEPFATATFSRVLASALLADTGWRVRPVVTTTFASLNFTENGAAMIVDAAATASDGDSVNLTGATVSIIAGFQSAADVLDCTPPAGITRTYNAGTGVLTLSGTSTVANYQTALRAVTYRNTSDDPTANMRTIRFVATDGVANGLASSRDVIVLPVNDTPSFVKGPDQSAGEGSGTKTVVGWATAISNPEAGQTLSFLVSANKPALFSVQPAISANGTLTFTPAANIPLHASDTAVVTVQLQDNGGGQNTSAPQTFNITILAVPGVLDVTFNPGVGANGTIYAIALLDNGKILIGGDFTQVSGVAVPYLARLNADGSVDTTFAGYLGGAPDGPVYSIVTQPDEYIPGFGLNRILLGGLFTTVAGDFATSLAKLRYGGTIYEVEYLDAYLHYPVPYAVRSVAWSSVTGDIAAGGDFIDNGISGEVVNRIGRWSATGQYLGSYTAGNGANATVRSVDFRILDGATIIAGDFQTVWGNSRPYFGLLSDTLQYVTGIAAVPNNSLYAMSQYPASQPEYGDILVGGAFTIVNGVNRGGVARLNSDGTLDVSFAGLAGANNTVYATGFDSTHKALIGGAFTMVDGATRSGVARLTTAGQLDTTFSPGSGASGTVRAIAVQNDGKILIGGSFSTYNGTSRNGIARLLP